MEEASKTAKIDSSRTEDLLSRLSSFLPEIKQSNKVLLQDPSVSQRQVDVDLKEESSGEGGSVASDCADDEANEDKAMIQFNLAVGNIDDNPMVQLLAGGDDADEDDDVSNENTVQLGETEQSSAVDPQTEVTVSKLLRGKRRLESDSLNSTPPKKPLITELS